VNLKKSSKVLVYLHIATQNNNMMALLNTK